MPEPVLRKTVIVWVNDQPVTVAAGTLVCVALLIAGASCRISLRGEPRSALCGMGICFECRAMVDGAAHQRTCQMVCREGMRLETQP